MSSGDRGQLQKQTIQNLPVAKQLMGPVSDTPQYKSQYLARADTETSLRIGAQPKTDLKDSEY